MNMVDFVQYKGWAAEGKPSVKGCMSVVHGPALWYPCLLTHGWGQRACETAALTIACPVRGAEVKQPSVGRKASSSQETIVVTTPASQAIATPLHLPLPAHWMESVPVRDGSSHSNQGFVNRQNLQNWTEVPNPQGWSPPLCSPAVVTLPYPFLAMLVWPPLVFTSKGQALIIKFPS